MLPQIISSRGPFKSTAGPFAVKFRVNTSVFSFMSIKIASQSKPLVAVIAAVWPRMCFAMAAAIETVSLKDISKKSKKMIYLYSPCLVKALGQDSQLKFIVAE